MFFNSLRVEDDRKLETGLSHNETVLILERSVDALIKEHPEKFEKYVYWFHASALYLLDKDEELKNIG